MKTPHLLKTWPEYFQEVWDDNKLFEVRKNDRDFKIWDEIHLQEWSPETKSYTGRELHAWISYILPGGSFGVQEGYAVLGLNIFSHNNP